MSASHDQAAMIGGACLLIAFVVILPLAYAMQAFRVYGPIWREAILATITPQFAAGMLFGIGLVLVGALIFAYGGRRA